MNIVVCIKQVPETSEVKIDEKTGVLIREGIDTKLNPYDLYALETALYIKAKLEAEINVISMGPPQAADILKEAFMMGADRGILLTDRKFAGADVLSTAYTLSQGIKKLDKVDLIICGKQTTDGDTAQVGPEIAEFQGIPHVTNVIKIDEVNNQSMIVETDMPSTIEKVKIQFPCLITVDKGIFQPRLPSFKLKQITRDREISFYNLKDFEDKNEKHYGLSGSPTQVQRIFPPQNDKEHETWKDNGEELAKTLAAKLAQLKFI